MYPFLLEKSDSKNFITNDPSWFVFDVSMKIKPFFMRFKNIPSYYRMLSQSEYSLGKVSNRSFFNNRFTISTGLGMDAPLGQTQASNLQQSILLLPDVTMEWLVNPSGTIRVSFFYRTNADFLSATSNAAAVRSRRAGGSLSYKKDFDRLINNEDMLCGGAVTIFNSSS